VAESVVLGQWQQTPLQGPIMQSNQTQRKPNKFKLKVRGKL
jgi:hypothetical protein